MKKIWLEATSHDAAGAVRSDNGPLSRCSGTLSIVFEEWRSCNEKSAVEAAGGPRTARATKAEATIGRVLSRWMGHHWWYEVTRIGTWGELEL
jgi:hypothetical protein